MSRNTKTPFRGVKAHLVQPVAKPVIHSGEEDLLIDPRRLPERDKLYGDALR